MTKKQLKQDVIMLITAVFSLLGLGALIFSFTEGWSLIDAFYFVTMTATTVGYGDFTPTTPLSKIFTVIYALSIIPFVLYSFSFVAKAQMNKVYSKIHHLEKQQKAQEEEIDAAERKIRLQKNKIQKQEEELEHQKKKISHEARVNKKQAEEIDQHDEELDLVEDIMEEALK